MKENATPRPRGSGSIFQNGSAVWWVKFYSNGIARRESSHSTDYKVAEKLLKRRLAETLTKTYVPREHIRIDELIADLFSDYRIHSLKSIEHAERRWKLHLKADFTRLRASDLTTDRIRAYIAKRQAEGAANANINRELALLKRAFNLGLECTPPKVKSTPFFPMLAESKPRRGFLESAGYAALAKECARVGLWLRTMFEIGYSYGWRHGEVLGLRVRQVDLLAGAIRLDVGSTKNNEGREVAMTQSVRLLLTECIRGKKPEDHVFTRSVQGKDGQVENQPVRNFRKTWAKVCCTAGVGELVCPTCENLVDTERHCAACGCDWTNDELKYKGLIFHDLRRTGVRNMVRAGISEKVAMTISGHITRSVFERYNIVAQSDLRDAARKLEKSQGLEREALEKSVSSELVLSSGRERAELHQSRGSADLAPLTTPMPN